MQKLNQYGIAHWIIPVVVVVIIGGVGAYLFGRSNAATCTTYTYKQGSSGQCVKDIQALVNYDLLTLDSAKYLTVDGQFGPQTRDYVKLLQARRGLTADGVVGAKTWKQICDSQKGPAPAWWTRAAAHAGC